MILAVGSHKGSPGATALATVLGLLWPTERVVMELDPRGADLPFRLMLPNGQPMATAPSIVGLAVDARPGSQPPPLERYAQLTALGVAVIPGELSARANKQMSVHLPSVATAAARWGGTAIADLGGMHAANPAMIVGREAEAVLLVTRPTLEGLGHLRDRIEELTDQVGDPRRTQLPVGVVLVTEPGNSRSGVEQATRLLASIGSPAPVLGVFAHDPAGARALWSGPSTKKLGKSALVRSGRDLVGEILRLWPTLAPAPAPDPAPVMPMAAQQWQPTGPPPAQHWQPAPPASASPGLIIGPHSDSAGPGRRRT